MLGEFQAGDVVTNRHVLVGLPALVEKRNDRRIDPVNVSVLRAVSDFASPYLTTRNRCPQVAHELFRVVTRIDDPVVLAQQLGVRVLRNAAKRVVHIVDDAALVGDRNYRGLVEGDFESGEFVERSLNFVADGSLLA